MPNAGRTAQALSVVTVLGLAAITSAQAHLVEDFGVRRGAPAHISLSTGLNGFVGAGIKNIHVDGVQMDAFSIDPFTMALRSSASAPPPRDSPPETISSFHSHCPLPAHPTTQTRPASCHRPDPIPSPSRRPSPRHGATWRADVLAVRVRVHVNPDNEHSWTAF